VQLYISAQKAEREEVWNLQYSLRDTSPLKDKYGALFRIRLAFDPCLHRQARIPSPVQIDRWLV
jgi:hypothetical protein